MPNKEGLAMPKGPRFRASRLATACLALSASIAIAGCSSEPSQRAYWGHPEDSQVAIYVFERCLIASQPPSATHYNDQDEVVEKCSQAAADLARYCPKGATDCLPQYQRTQSEVQAILPRDTDGNPKGGDATQAPSDSLTAGAEGIAQGGSHD